jgi:ribosomal protein S18 acetylase RimI-like enzyme
MPGPGWIDQNSLGILFSVKRESGFEIQSISLADRAWIQARYKQRWGSNRVVSRGELYTVSELPGFIAWKAAERIGLLTYHVAGEELEIVTLDSFEPRQGVGTALLAATEELARKSGLRRIWLVTSNDNTPALRFYQRRGFHLAALHRDALRVSRRIKPEIPLTGLDEIPIRDEIELEYLLT